MATPAELQAAIAAVAAGNQSASQAAAVNAAYMQNALPVIPKYAPPTNRILVWETSHLSDPRNQQGTPVYLTQQEYYERFGMTEAQAEQQKHDIAWSQPRSDVRALSGEALAISQMYEAQHKQGMMVGTQGAYLPTGQLKLSDPSGDVGITGRAAAQWGAASFAKTPTAAPIQRSMLYGQEPTVERTSTVPTREAGTMQTFEGKTFYVPYGEQAQTEIKSAKGVFDPIGGRIGLYQVPGSVYESEGGFKRIYGWETSSGSTGALQSGMFSIGKALTDVVYTQESAGGKYAAGVDVARAEEIKAHPELYSRLGAERYGGIVSPMVSGEAGKLKPGTEMGRYAPETGNLANLVDPFGVNRPKQELLATEPWKIDWATSPALQTMTGAGFAGTTLTPLAASEYEKVGMAAPIATNALTGMPMAFSKIMTMKQDLGTIGGAKIVSISKGEGSGVPGAAIWAAGSTAPEPTAAQKAEYRPSGFLGLGGLLPEVDAAHIKAYTIASKSRPFEAAMEQQGAMLSPFTSTLGGVASRLTFGASEILYKPTPILKEKGTPGSVSVSTVDGKPETSISGGSAEITALGTWLTENKEKVDRYNAEEVAAYNAKVEKYNLMQQENPLIVTTKGSTTTTTTTTEGKPATYYASEWDKFVEGSGRVGRFLTGQTLAKQAAYETTLKGDTSLIGEGKRALFYFGTELTNKPAELAPAAITGWALAGAPEVIGGLGATLAAGTGKTGAAARLAMTPTGQSVIKGVTGLVFAGAYGYGVTEGGTATFEKTRENIYRSTPSLIAMGAGGGMLNWMGETRVVKGTAPSGATLKGVAIYDQVFGGGKTPEGKPYVVAGGRAATSRPGDTFQDAFIHVFEKKEPTVRTTEQLRLPGGREPAGGGFEDAGLGGGWTQPTRLPEVTTRNVPAAKAPSAAMYDPFATVAERKVAFDVAVPMDRALTTAKPEALPAPTERFALPEARAAPQVAPKAEYADVFPTTKAIAAPTEKPVALLGSGKRTIGDLFPETAKEVGRVPGGIAGFDYFKTEVPTFSVLEKGYRPPVKYTITGKGKAAIELPSAYQKYIPYTKQGLEGIKEWEGQRMNTKTEWLGLFKGDTGELYYETMGWRGHVKIEPHTVTKMQELDRITGGRWVASHIHPYPKGSIMGGFSPNDFGFFGRFNVPAFRAASPKYTYEIKPVEGKTPAYIITDSRDAQLSYKIISTEAALGKSPFEMGGKNIPDVPGVGSRSQLTHKAIDVFNKKYSAEHDIWWTKEPRAVRASEAYRYLKAKAGSMQHAGKFSKAEWRRANIEFDTRTLEFERTAYKEKYANEPLEMITKEISPVAPVEQRIQLTSKAQAPTLVERRMPSIGQEVFTSKKQLGAIPLRGKGGEYQYIGKIEEEIVQAPLKVQPKKAGYTTAQMRMAYQMKDVPYGYGTPRSYLAPEPTDFPYRIPQNVPMAGTEGTGYPMMKGWKPSSSLQKMIESKRPAFNLFEVEPTFSVATGEKLAMYGRGKISPTHVGGGRLEHKEGFGANVFGLKKEHPAQRQRAITTERIPGTNIFRIVHPPKEAREVASGGGGGGYGSRNAGGGGVVLDVTGASRLSGKHGRSGMTAFLDSMIFSSGFSYEGVDLSPGSTTALLPRHLREKPREMEWQEEYYRSRQETEKATGLKIPERPRYKDIALRDERLGLESRFREQSLTAAERAALAERTRQKRGGEITAVPRTRSEIAVRARQRFGVVPITTFGTITTQRQQQSSLTTVIPRTTTISRTEQRTRTEVIPRQDVRTFQDVITIPRQDIIQRQEPVTKQEIKQKPIIDEMSWLKQEPIITPIKPIIPLGNLGGGGGGSTGSPALSKRFGAMREEIMMRSMLFPGFTGAPTATRYVRVKPKPAPRRGR